MQGKRLESSILLFVNFFFLSSIFFESILSGFSVIILLFLAYVISIRIIFEERKISFSDFYFVFVSLFFLYGFVNPAVELYQHGYLFEHTKTSVLLYQIAISSFCLGYFLFSRVVISNVVLNKSRLALVLQFAILFFLLALVLFKSVIIFNNTSFFVIFSGGEIKRLDDITQAWVVMGYVVTAVYLYVIYNHHRFERFFIALFIIIFFLYVFAQLSVGNRRDFLPILIGFFWMYTRAKTINVSFFKLSLMSLFVFAMLVFSSLRLGLGGIEASISDALRSNEFVYPFYTLSINVQIREDFIFGYSYFILPLLFFIPRFLYEDKPQSLAHNFVVENFGEGSMGYAYNLVAESYVNFGLFGPYIFFFIIGVFIKRRVQSNDQRFIFVLYCMIPDICRGEFSSLVYQFFFLSMFLIIIPFFWRKIWLIK